jgi:ParB-like nuclease domain
MTDAELADLAEDIATNGLVHPIVVDADGALIDGRNRLRACEIAGVEPAFQQLNGHYAKRRSRGARGREPRFAQPGAGQRALLTDPGLVGEPDLHRPAERFPRDGGGHKIAKAAPCAPARPASDRRCASSLHGSGDDTVQQLGPGDDVAQDSRYVVQSGQ